MQTSLMQTSLMQTTLKSKTTLSHNHVNQWVELIDMILTNNPSNHPFVLHQIGYTPTQIRSDYFRWWFRTSLPLPPPLLPSQVMNAPIIPIQIVNFQKIMHWLNNMHTVTQWSKIAEQNRQLLATGLDPAEFRRVQQKPNSK